VRDLRSKLKLAIPIGFESDEPIGRAACCSS